MTNNTCGEVHNNAFQAHSPVRRFTEDRLKPEKDREPLAESLVNSVDTEKDKERLWGVSFHEGANGPQNGSSSVDVFEEVSQLQDVSERLEKSWLNFQTTLSRKDPSHQSRHSKPDIKILAACVKIAEETREKNQETTGGKAKAVYVRVVESMDEHKYLFDLLPSGDRYVSILTGTLTAIVKATTIHQDTISIIAAGLEEISDQVRDLYLATQLSPKNTTIRRHMVSFYCSLFKFLALLLNEWYNKSWFKRATRSLGSSFRDHVKGLVVDLKKHTKKVEREQVHIVVEKLNQLGAMLGRHLDRQTQQGLLYPQEQQEERRRKSERQIGGMQPGPAPKLLDAAAPCQTPRGDQCSPDPLHVDDLAASESASWTAWSIRSNVVELECLSQESTISRLGEEALSVFVDQFILLRLQDWVYKRSSEALWIRSTFSDEEPAPNTLNAVFMLASLRRFKIPELAWFCTYDSSDSWTEEFIKLVYSLIHQAALSVPDHLNSGDVRNAIDFSKERFDCLTGELRTLPEAIVLLENLLSLGPPLMFIIISGWQLLERREDPELQGYLRQLLGALCRLAEKADSRSRIFKIGFFTDGWSESLKDAEDKELLVANVFEDKSEKLPLEFGNLEIEEN